MKDTNDKTVAQGDVIQIIPGTLSIVFDGCFAVVDEVRDWGVIADVYMNNNESAPIRLASNQFEYVGAAPFRRV